MPIWRGSFIFEAGKNGWTETWYCNGATRDLALAKMEALVPKRQAFLGSFAAIIALRVIAEFPATGESRIKMFDAPVAGAAASVRDTPWNAIECLCTAGRSRRVMWLRGVPDLSIAISTGGVGDPAPGSNKKSATISQALDAWASEIVKDTGLMVKQLARKGDAFDTPPGPLVDYAVQDVTRVAAPVLNRTHLILPGHPFVFGDTVKVGKGRTGGVPWLGGMYRVLSAVEGVSIDIATPNDLGNPIQYKGGTIVTAVRYNYPNIRTCDYGRFASRQTGRALFVSAGARRRGWRR